VHIPLVSIAMFICNYCFKDIFLELKFHYLHMCIHNFSELYNISMFTCNKCASQSPTPRNPLSNPLINDFNNNNNPNNHHNNNNHQQPNSHSLLTLSITTILFLIFFLCVLATQSNSQTTHALCVTRKKRRRYLAPSLLASTVSFTFVRRVNSQIPIFTKLLK
jgi:ATP-dependent Zn protease